MFKLHTYRSLVSFADGQH